MQYRDGYNFTWANGRQLSTVTNGANTYSYTYNADGLRTSKTVNGTTTEYYWMGSVLQGQKTGSEYILYLYDENGTAYGFLLKNGTTQEYYYYIFNVQGDVIGILDSNGTKVVSYEYSAWGEVLSVTGTLASTIGQTNPIRYRGYYHDTETGFYYVSSRYYDPEIGRFINADDIDYLGADGSPLSYNLFAYCMNNPVNRFDVNGNLSMPNWLKVTVGAVATVAAVAVTVATGGAAAPVLIGVATSTVASATVSAVSHRVSTGSWQGAGKAALDGAADGFMWGGIGSLATSTVGAVRTTASYKKTVDTYNSLQKQYKGSGMEAHHIIEQRLAKGSNWKLSKMPSIELSKSDHRVYTNAWKNAVPYGTKYNSSLGYKFKLYKASNNVYSESRVLRMAARITIFKM